MQTQNLINQFKELGYKVAYPKKGLTTYFFYSDGTKIGYCQLDKFGIFTLSSKYIPTKNFGTGSQYKEDLCELKKEDIEKSFTHVIWEGQYGKIEPPKFYKDLEHFISKHWEELTIE